MQVALGPADLNDGEMRGYEPAPKRFVLVARVEGRFHALDDVCNHAGCHLSGGWMEGPCVVCPCHEYAFDVRTGEQGDAVKMCESQPVFPLTVREGVLFVDLPERRR
jgi:3-phenylpropionate/trans-cinnamate dioxygenase ferredoxin subunit